MGSPLTVWDGDGQPSSADDQVWYWTGYEKPIGHSLLAYCEQHGTRLREKYLDWVAQAAAVATTEGDMVESMRLRARGVSYWWFTPLVEKSRYQSQAVSDTIRLFALEEILREARPSSVRVVTANAALKDAIDRLCEAAGLPYSKTKWRNRAASLVQGLMRAPSWATAFAGFGRALLRQWPLKRVSPKPWHGGQRTLFFCSYFDGISTVAVDRGEFQSDYWGTLNHHLHQRGRTTNWLQLFIPYAGAPTAAAAAAQLSKVNAAQASETHAFVDSALTVSTALVVLRHWIYLQWWRMRHSRAVRDVFRPPASQLDLWPVHKADWIRGLSGWLAIKNLFSIEHFDAILGAMPRQECGVYLCENQPWERALIHAWRRHGHGQIAGVTHSTVRFWDLRYFNASSRRFATAESIEPDRLAVNGPAAMRLCREGGHSLDRLVESEALRYQYLGLTNNSQPRAVTTAAVKRVLVLGDYSAEATERLLHLLQGANALLGEPCRYILKAHPNCPVDLQRYPDLALELTDARVMDALPQCDLAYTSNMTSAAVDAFLMGVATVVMLDDRELNFSPLRGLEGATFVSTAEQLASALGGQPATPRISSADFFYIDERLPRWCALLGV